MNRPDRTEKVLFAVIALGVFMISFAIFRGCEHPKPIKTDTQITTIREQIKIHDTTILPLETIKIHYRNRFDTVRRWLYDTTWDNICGLVGSVESKPECQREVGRRLLAGQRDSQFVQIYISQRKRDSTVIRGLKLIDTILTARLEVCVTENRGIVKVLAKETRRKSAYKAAAIGLTGLILIK